MKRTILAAALLWATVAQAETWRGSAVPLTDEVWQGMQGVSWHDGLGCPDRDALRLLSVPFNAFDGTRAEGRMIVAVELAEEVLDIFAALGEVGFAIEKMQLVEEYDGSDDLSMAANNTSAFNCRTTPGSKRMSQHSFGRAIDINPVQNPYLFQGQVMPPEGAAFDTARERKAEVQGIVRKGDAVVAAFRKRGWGWGGDWKNSKDYQHFSKSGN